ncbi:MAG: HD domain-containing protein [Phycisphaerales bacterium]|nr:HD domain-containing protein [Phycisphaerales bacterium]
MPTTVIARPRLTNVNTCRRSTHAVLARIEPAYTPDRAAAQRHVDLVDALHRETAHHLRRVSELAGALAAATGADPDTIETTRLVGLLHDIGKAAIDPALLDAPRRLTMAERTIINRHAELGARMLDGDDTLSHLREAVARHHDRWEDGGCEIPLAARIVAVVDAWDAMTMPRPYAPPMDPFDARQELRRCAGTQFDPELVGIFLAVVAPGLALARSA